MRPGPILLVAALLLAGCGSAATSTPPQRHYPDIANANIHPGSSYSLDGPGTIVVVDRIVDPAPTAASPFGRAHREVIFALTLTAEPNTMGIVQNTGGTAVVSEGTQYRPVADISVRGSDGKIYKAFGVSDGSCRGYGPGMYTIPEGEKVVGCLGFVVPAGTRITMFRMAGKITYPPLPPGA